MTKAPSITPSHRPPSRLAALLAVATTAQALLLIVAHRPTLRALRGDEIHYHGEALDLLAGKPAEPLFVFPPLYSRFLATLYAMLGPDRIVVELAQALLLIGSGVLFYRLLLRAGMANGAAAGALALLLLDPQIAAFAGYLWPEVLHLFLLLWLVHLLTGGAEPGFPRMAAAGAICGICLLTKSLLVPFVPVLLAAAGLRSTANGGRRLARALAFSLGLGAIVLPVVVSHGRRHGYWGVSNTGPFNIWVGLNDPANRTDYDAVVVPEGLVYLGSSADPAERNRIVWSKIRQRVHEQGMWATLGNQAFKQYPRLFDKDSFFTDQLPGGRWRRDETSTWVAGLLRFWAYVAYGLGLALAAVGVWVADWRRRWRAMALPALFLAYNTGLFLLLHVKTRYRVAFWPCMLFFAAVAIERFSGGALLRATAGTGPGKLALSCGAVTALLMLWLAFAGS